MILVSPASICSPTTLEAIDTITARLHLMAALEQFLGVTGTAIPTDILKVDGREVLIRVPREDASFVIGALSGWTGNGVAWRVRRSGIWLQGVVRGNGQDLFER